VTGCDGIETQILLTSTTSLPRVADAVISYMLALPGNEDVASINPIVGETNDGLSKTPSILSKQFLQLFVR
jgi:hypothetical protein